MSPAHINSPKFKVNKKLFQDTLIYSLNTDDYRMEITGVFRDALTRQADKAIRIFSRENSELLNSKSEFNHLPIRRVVVEKK